MIIGYARDSGASGTIGEQWQKLTDAGCARIFADPTGAGRRGLNEALGVLAPDDELLVVDLVALGRSSKDLIQALEKVFDTGGKVRSLDGSLDTITSQEAYALISGLISTLAAFDKDRARDRARSSLQAANPRKTRGRRGTLQTVVTEEKRTKARELLADPDLTIEQVRTTLGVSRATLYRMVGNGGTSPTRYTTPDQGGHAAQDAPADPQPADPQPANQDMNKRSEEP